MIRWKQSRLERLSRNRLPGYLEAARACGTVDGDELVFDPESECYRNLQGMRISKPISRTSSTPPSYKGGPPPNRLPGWHAVVNTWVKAVSFGKSAASRGMFATVANSGGEKAVAGKRSLRILSCFGGDGQPPCPALDYDPVKKFHFCHDCGCGDREIARLDSVGSTQDSPLFTPGDYDKLHYPYLECPRKRPGFSNEET